MDGSLVLVLAAAAAAAAVAAAAGLGGCQFSGVLCGGICLRQGENGVSWEHH